MTSWHEGRSLSVCAEAGDVDIHWAPCQSLNGGDQGCKELQQTHVHIEGALTKSMPCSIYCGLAQAAVHLIKFAHAYAHACTLYHKNALLNFASAEHQHEVYMHVHNTHVHRSV